MRMRGPIVRLLATADPVARVYYALLRRFSKLYARPVVVVYHMGKVGSTTVRSSIAAATSRLPVFAVHTLTEDGHQTLAGLYRTAGVPLFPRGRHLLISRLLMDQLERDNGARWKIVTLVRDPVARNLSLLFQVGDLLLPNFQRGSRICGSEVERLSARIEERYPAQVRCLNWFADELEPVFGVDVLAAPFPRKRGYAIYRGDRADVLLIKLERLEERANEALGEFLGLDEFRLIERNVSARKPYAAAYRRFLREVALSDAYLDRFYDTPLMRHLYTDRELAGFRARWSGRAVEEVLS